MTEDYLFTLSAPIRYKSESSTTEQHTTQLSLLPPRISDNATVIKLWSVWERATMAPMQYIGEGTIKAVSGSEDLQNMAKDPDADTVDAGLTWDQVKASILLLPETDLLYFMKLVEKLLLDSRAIVEGTTCALKKTHIEQIAASDYLRLVCTYYATFLQASTPEAV